MGQHVQAFIDFLSTLKGLRSAVILDVATLKVVASWGNVIEPEAVLREIGVMAKAKVALHTALRNDADRDNPVHEGLFSHSRQIHVLRSILRDEFKFVVYCVFDRQRTNMATVRLAIQRFSDLM